MRKENIYMNAKKLIAGGMAALMLAGGALGVPAQAQAGALQQKADLDLDKNEGQNLSEQMPEGGMRTEFIKADAFRGAGTWSLRNLQETPSYSLAASEWAASGNDYYFSLLNTAEKKLYLNLKKQADLYMTGMDNFLLTEAVRDGQTVKAYVLPLISYEGLSTEQMKKVFCCFLFENPQYYFIRNSVIYSENTNMMTAGLYEMFADGAVRAEYTAQFAEQLKIWDSQIAEMETAAEKERLIHDIVCGHADYNSNAVVDDPQDPEMSQSCISAVLFSRTTVCAGYAQLFTLLCSRAGISCVTVTSDTHAWNKVCMGSVWYNVDCTWNDSRGDDTFFNVTDEQLKAADTEKQEHTPSAEWENRVPSCTVLFDTEMANGPDLDANVLAPAGVPVIADASSTEKGALAVSFSQVEECDGYSVQYAVNGAMLSAAKADTENLSCLIAGLKSGKTYYVRVRAYELDRNGEKLYGAYSGKVKAVIL